MTQEAEEMRNLLLQKKAELEALIQDAESRLEEQDELNQAMQSEKIKLQNVIQGLEEQ